MKRLAVVAIRRASKGYLSVRIYANLSEPLEYIQIYGERNSGTDYLRAVLQDNMRTPANLLGLAESDVTPLGSRIFGYKHWFPRACSFRDERQPRTLFVIIYRNPYTWLRAMLARPYALAASIGGKELQELPHVGLIGQINGRLTKNEFHPETGEQVNIFQLRSLKIAAFESVRSHVCNAIFVNVETLVDDASQLIASLSNYFPGVLRDTAPVVRRAPAQLSRECSCPAPFSEDHHALIDAHIEWSLEQIVGYEIGNYGVRR